MHLHRTCAVHCADTLRAKPVHQDPKSSHQLTTACRCGVPRSEFAFPTLAYGPGTCSAALQDYVPATVRLMETSRLFCAIASALAASVASAAPIAMGEPLDLTL